MERALCLLMFAIAALTGANGQDFTSRFMESHAKDTLVKCLTVSPKMMNRITRFHIEGNDGKDDAERILSKLKSARIVTSRNGKEHFAEAKTLLQKNKQRFTLLSESRQDGTHTIFVRKRNDIISELVMLSLDKEGKLFTIINFTGEMDKTFIETLTHEWDDKADNENNDIE